MKYNYIILQMVNLQVILFLSFLILNKCASTAAANKDKLQILTISDKPQSVSKPIYSSVQGGKNIYINLIGHTIVATDISVTVGKYPCKIIADGVNSDFIVCATTKCIDSNDYNKELFVTVIVASKKQVDVTKSPFSVYYSPSNTPKTTEIFPTSNYAGQTTAVEGIHKSSDVGSGQSTGNTEIKLDKSVGDRSNVTQNTIFGYNQNQKINVKQNQDNEAGKKNITEKNNQNGNSDTSPLKKATLQENQEFHYTTLPAITKVTNNGSEDGHQIEIKGTGFSPNNTRNNVTVDGQNCKITQSSSNKIKCILDKKDDNSTSQLETNTTSVNQSNGYISGVGLNYKRYINVFAYDILQWSRQIKINNSLIPTQVSIKTQLKSPDTLGSFTGQTWKGYFKAPINGTYTFRGWGQYSFAMFFAKVHGSTELPQTPLIYSNTPQNSWDSFFIDNIPTASASVELIQDYSYYIQVYHLSYVYKGKFKISVEVPNKKRNLKYQVYPVTQITLNTTVQPEVVTFNMMGGTGGTINLKIVRIDNRTLKISYNRTVNITYGCSQSQFLNAIYQFDCYQPYVPSVVKTMYDSSGSNTSDLTKAVRIEYNVSLYLMRPPTCQTQKFVLTYYSYKGKFTQAQTVKHSPLINGTFGLKFDGSYINKGNISYDVSSSALKDYFQQYKSMENIIINKITSFGCSYQCKWIISFKGYHNELPTIFFDTTKLTGGSNQPKLFNNTIRNFSRNVIFQPVDYRFLHTASSLPNVLVSVNQIPAVCLTNCTYQFLKVFKIVSLLQNGSILNIQVVNVTALPNIPLPMNLDISQIVIKADDISCSIITNLSNLSAFSFTCQLPTNFDGSPLLPAGEHEFKVYIPTIGFIGLGNGVSPIAVNYTLSTLKTLNGTLNGGFSNSIFGRGFAKKNKTINNLNDKNGKNGKNGNKHIAISICGNPAHITFISNRRIDFIQPPCSAAGTFHLNFTYGYTSHTNLTFTYVVPAANLPTISSISPKMFNPMVKSTLNISGSNFGTNLSAINVYLTNSSGRVYQLRVIKITNSLITCGLPGGLPGNYTVQVNYPYSTGNALLSAINVDLFSYVSKITGVYPNFGSFFGGTLLTIVGINFSPAYSDTLVYIGDMVNWFCKIQSINDTVITCLTPPISSAYQVGEQQQVYVSTKLTHFSQCTQNCSFSYMNITDSPLVSNISLSYNTWGVLVTVDGTGLTQVSGCTFRFRAQLTGKITDLPALNCFNTTANVTLPNTLAAGKYWVSILDDLGEGNPSEITLLWLVGNTSNNTGSTQGFYAYITGGSFYPAELDLNYRIDVSPSKMLSQKVKVIECCSNNSVKIYFPPAPDGTYFILNFISPVGSSQQVYYAYTTSTPKVKIMSPSNLTVAPGTISFRLNTSVNFAATATNVTLESIINKNQVITFSNFNATPTICNFTVTLSAGAYRLKVNSSSGYFSNNPTDIINVSVNNITSSTKNISFAGGNYTIYGNSLSSSSYLNLYGYKAYPINYNSTAVTYKIPAFVTLNTQAQFKFAQAGLIDLSNYQTFSDQNAATYDKNPFDGSLNTLYQSSNNECWFGIDFGGQFVANISRVKFFPNKQWPSAIKLLNASIQGSNNKSNWTNIVVIDSTVHTAWNNFLPLTNSPFRYIRFLHNSTSACNIAELQLYGIVYNAMAPSLTNTPCGMVYNDGYNSLNLSSFLKFRSDRTPIIESLSQQYGDIFGGYNLTLYGSSLGFSNDTSVLIDNIPCILVSSNTSQITCLVGARPKIPSQNTFTVIIDNNVAIIRSQFLYVLKWSDERTWGVDLPPAEDDIVFVPAGMTLYVDQSTPKLAGIAVQNGTIIFANNTNITVNTGFIDVVGGQFIAGTEQQPLHSNLTFILYGDYYDAQQPIGGNKMIFCLQCKFSMYGKPKKTWTTLANTVLPDYNVITLNEDVDWTIGDQIVVASTSFNPNQAEMKTVVQVNGRNITVDTPFKYPHLSTMETYTSGDFITISAEVGLLSRNIKVRGDSTTNITKYGAHLMLYGQSTNGFEAKVAYSEFTMCGQPQIPGRYCIYFHNNGESFESFAKGNSVYESYGRVVTIHAGQFITVDGNVGYRAAGHNFYLQDGIQTNNLIQNNLAINSLSVNNMMQSDIMVASFYIRHPNNYLIGNRAAGSQFYGFLFNLPSYPTGSSASKDVCPQGSKLGSFVNNVAHSNKYHGLRVTNLYARTNACYYVKNEYLLNDLWTQNPSIPTLMHNFTAFKNQLKGVLLQNIGNFILNNFTVAQNLNAGIEFYLANFTKELIVVNNSVVIGKSQNNADSNSDLYSKLQGLVTPRSGSINVTNVRFYSFPSGGNAFVTCSQCNDYRYYTNIGNQIFVQGLKFSQIGGKYLAMLGGKRDIIYDSDGSLSLYFDGVNRTKTTMIAKYPHIYSDNPNHCFAPSNTSLWDDTWLCDSSLIIRRIMITNLIGSSYYYSFNGVTMYVAPIQNQTVLKQSINSSYITSINSHFLSQPHVQKHNAWSMPYVAGTKYNVWFSTSDDFSHLSISASTLYKSTQPGIVFKFAYTRNRQLYIVGPRRGGVFPSGNLLKNPSNDYLQVDSCWNGDYYHNNDNSSLRMIQVCQSGKNRTLYEYTQVNAVFCKHTCPAPVVSISSCSVSKQSFIRRWSNASQWPSGVLPKQGDNVTISCKWTMMIDVNPPAMQLFIVDGILLVDDTFDINITAKAIHIRSGTLNVGTNGSPFQHKFVIQINGNKEDGTYYVDPFINANKFFVITGALSLNGPKPDTQITYLTQTALKGTTTLFVGAKVGWKVGDQITLSPSFSNASEFEKVKITVINSDGSLTIEPPLKYTHYGASSPTIVQSYGTLDARTRVGHLTRNIKVVSGGDQSWGFAVYVYAYNDGNMRLGNAVFNGVQFVSGGQEQVRPSLQFLNLLNSIATSSVIGSSFHNCLHSCLSVQNSKDISITSNVFYNIRGAGASMSTTYGFTFEDNLIVGVKGGSGTVPPSCFSSISYVDLSYGSVNVHDNFCQGSQGYGFIIPHIGCDDLNLNPFSSNTAGSCNVGFIFNSISQDCQASSYLSAYACNIGQLANPEASTIKFSKFILADNKIGAILKFGNTLNSQNNTAFFQNSYITALSRPSCSQCYDVTACSGLTGLRMLTVTSTAKTVQDNLGIHYDIVDNEQLLDAKAYLTNITFDSFRQQYSPTTYPTSIAAGCRSNFVMKTNPYAVDMIGGHYLFNSKCDNCDNTSFIYCDALSSQYLGLSGGCGDILCTGKSNYIVMDWNGTFFGNVSTVIPNNPLIGNNEANCTAYSQMNGHLCNRQDFVVLEYESTAPDYNSRIMWPVNLTGNNSNYTTVVNGWREWNWQGSIPQGTRLGRFISLIKLYSVYNLTFTSMPPLQLKFKLQRRTPNGNNSYWTMVKIYYPLPNSIQVKVGGQTLLPIIMTNTDGTGLRRQINVSKCGDNIFFFSNKTIQFVLTEDPDCVVMISLSDSIQLTTHFAMNASDFFSNTVMSSFISNLCALLNIVDQSRVKVVGVYAGSAIVSVYISANGSAPAAPGADPNQQNIASILSQSISNGSFADSMSSVVGYQVITASSSLSVLPDLTTQPDTSATTTIKTSDPKFIISIIVGVVLVVFGVIVLMCYLYKKHMSAKQEIANNQNEKEIELQMKEQSHAIIMSEDVIFNNESTVTSPVREDTPQKKQKRNRRVRQRQTLQIRQFD